MEDVKKPLEKVKVKVNSVNISDSETEITSAHKIVSHRWLLPQILVTCGAATGTYLNDILPVKPAFPVQF